MTAAVCFWVCIECSTIGDTSRSGEAHTRETQHTTMTGTDPERLARMRELIAEDAETARQLRAARLALAAVRDVREARKAEQG